MTHSPDAHNLFLTASIGDNIGLWDLRTDECVRRFSGHLNRSHPVGLAFSPCARYIGTGSEDRHAYLYDVRMGTYSHKIGGHTDVVTDISFHPFRAELMTACQDGKLRIHRDE